MRRLRVMSAAGAVGVMGLMATASVAWACLPGGGAAGTLAVSPRSARGGQEVAVSGLARGSSPVAIRLNSTTAPELVSLIPGGRAGSEFQGTVRIPIDAQLGEGVLIATQEGRTWRTTISIVAGDGTPLPLAPAAPPIPRGKSGMGLMPLVGAALLSVLVVVGVVVLVRRSSRNSGGTIEEAATRRGAEVDPTPGGSAPPVAHEAGRGWGGT